MIYKNRQEAALSLVEKLIDYQDCDGVVIAIPRGGVPLGFVISCSLHLPLQVIPSKKIRHPVNKEYIIGSVCIEDEVMILPNNNIAFGYIKSEIEKVQQVLIDRYYNYNENWVSLKNKIVIVVDDGIVTGSKMQVTLKYIKSKNPKEIILATPVASKSTLENLQLLADKIICLQPLYDLDKIERYYDKFEGLTDDDVIAYLRKAETLLI